MKNLFNTQLLSRLERSGVIAVLEIDRVADAEPLAKALLSGGIDVMELTLRTPAAIDSLLEIKAKVPEMLAGCGTVLTPEQVEEVKNAGADFAVAPGTNPRVINHAKQIGLPFAPGIATPADIEISLECGCRLLKFFPAESSGGVKQLKSMSGPYKHLGLSFIPLGGLNQDNMKSYLEIPQVIALGGSWIAPRELIQSQNWSEITNRAAKAKSLV